MSPRRAAGRALVLFLVVSWWPGAASAQAPLLDPALMPRARAEGTVRAIVELGGLNVVPEGSLRDEVSVSAQRRSIGAVQDVVGQALRGMRHRLVRRFETVPLVAIEASPDALRVLESMRGVVLRVYKDAIEAPALAQSGPLVGAPGAWDVGRDGSGTVIAVVDSGVDGNHPFLAGKVIEEACFSSNEPGRSVTVCPNGQETQLGTGAGGPCSIPACDHGTHVAGIAAGAGSSFSGIARGARIMAIQVNSRFTTSADCGGPPPCARIWTSDMIAALERVHRLRAVHNFGAVNISIGGGGFTAPCDDDPRKFIIDNLRAADIATVISSGNGGFTNALSAPACISTAVSVGNTTKSDTVGETSNVASFLSLFAPGTSIASSVPGGGFASFVGTSMAAPHVAGAFAILKQAIPGATVGHLLQALQLTGRPIADVTGIVKSRVHVDAALSAFTPFSAIEANGPAFRAGQVLTLNLTADNPPGNPTFDLYVGALFPDGNSIAFLTAPNLFGGAGQLSSPAGVRPMMALGAGVTVNTVVLQFAFPAAGLPAGTYRAFAALVRQGALADNAWNDGDLVWLDVVDVAYAP